MDYKDYYKILGVERNVSEKEMKRVYRRLARQFHPDVNPGKEKAEERFKEINEAYEVLSDPEKRAKYDQLGASWQQWQRRGGDSNQFDWSRWRSGAPGGVHVDWSGNMGDLFGGSGSEVFSDFFRSMFGGMGRTSRAGTGGDGFGRSPGSSGSRGADVEAQVEITLEEALHGTTRVLEQGGRRIRVKIPPGARSGSTVRVAGKGRAGNIGSKPGDLLLRIAVASHPVYEREGNNLRRDVEVGLYVAVLGGAVRVQTLDGDVSLKIPAGTNSGKVFRLRAKGMRDLHGPDRRGDLLVKVQVQVPAELDARERELFQELAHFEERKLDGFQ